MSFPQPPDGREWALCCACGTRRTVSTKYYGRRDYDDHEGGVHRVMVGLRCDHCGVRTGHARLRSDEYRDAAEELNELHRQERIKRGMVRPPDHDQADDVQIEIEGTFGFRFKFRGPADQAEAAIDELRRRLERGDD